MVRLELATPGLKLNSSKAIAGKELSLSSCFIASLYIYHTREKLQRKMTNDYYWLGVQENIGMFSTLKSGHNSLI